MLAEPKAKKLKWSSDPQNLRWANDQSKFGLKMLEKMGWEEGKGLGKDGTGMNSHVEIRPIVDNKGLGFESTDTTVQLAQQSAYDNLLESLNKKYPQKKEREVTSATNDSVERTCFAIEKGTAKTRPLRYKKIIQEKDLSTKSKEEISSIFYREKSSKKSLKSDSKTSNFCGIKTQQSRLDSKKYFIGKTESHQKAKYSIKTYPNNDCKNGTKSN